MTTPVGAIRVDGPWNLTPEGAAIHAAERTAVIADVHLGYEWARGAAGDCVPSHSLEETVTRLVAVLARARRSRGWLSPVTWSSPRARADGPPATSGG